MKLTSGAGRPNTRSPRRPPALLQRPHDTAMTARLAGRVATLRDTAGADWISPAFPVAAKQETCVAGHPEACADRPPIIKEKSGTGRALSSSRLPRE